MVVAKNETTTTIEKNQQNDVNTNASKETKTDFKYTHERVSQIIWMCFFGSLVLLAIVVLLMKRFKLI